MSDLDPTIGYPPPAHVVLESLLGGIDGLFSLECRGELLQAKDRSLALQLLGGWACHLTLRGHRGDIFTLIYTKLLRSICYEPPAREPIAMKTRTEREPKASRQNRETQQRDASEMPSDWRIGKKTRLETESASHHARKVFRREYKAALDRSKSD